MKGKTFVCYCCGTYLEPKEGHPPCHDLAGWVTVSHCRGRGAVDHYTFCSIDCLRDSLSMKATPVPDVFLRSFDEA